MVWLAAMCKFLEVLGSQAFLFHRLLLKNRRQCVGVSLMISKACIVGALEASFSSGPLSLRRSLDLMKRSARLFPEVDFLSQGLVHQV